MAAAANQTILLSPTGTYLVGSSLTLGQNGTFLGSTGSGRVTLKATNSLSGRILNANASGYTIHRMKFVGRKAYGHDIGDLPAADCHTYGQNVALQGSSFLVDDTETMDATCGSGMTATGSEFEIRNSYFHDNGIDSDDSWADGLTVFTCDDCSVHDNTMEDNTDIGLVVGGGSGGTFEDNTITNTDMHAFAGLHVGWFNGGDGDHAGITYESNTITSSEDMMAFGIVVGFEPWYDGLGANGFVSDAGSVVYNTVNGAVVNLAIEGVGGGYIMNNSLSNNQGTWGFNCSTSVDYTAHFYGNATIQSGWSAYWFAWGSCGTWNTGLPQPDSVGALRRNMELIEDEPFYSDGGAYYLNHQGDGNLVLYNSSHVSQWATGTSTGDRAIMGRDGNLGMSRRLLKFSGGSVDGPYYATFSSAMTRPSC